MIKRLLFCLLLLLTSINKVWSQDEVQLDRLERYIIDNYSLPESLKADCHYNYLAMVIESNTQGEIMGIRYLNEAHHDLKASLDYVKIFRFDASMNVKNRPILLFVTIDQQDRKRCPYLHSFGTSPKNVTSDIVQIIMKQLRTDPKTILMSVIRFIAPVPPVTQVPPVSLLKGGIGTLPKR